MADEERRPDWEDEEDPNAGEISMTPMQVSTSDEDSSVGTATHTSGGNGERVGTFIEMQPKFRELQRQIRAYANAHPEKTGAQSSGATVSRTSSSSYSLPKTPARPVAPQKPKGTTPTFRRGVRTGGQATCDVFCYLTTLALFLVALFAYGYCPYTDTTMLLPQFILEESTEFVSPLIRMFQTLDGWDNFGSAMDTVRFGFIGINALVFLIQMHVFIIKCFVALCKKNCIGVRTTSMKMFRTLIYHYLALAMLGDETYAMSSVLKTFLILAGIVYFIIALCNAPNHSDSVQTERFVWKNRLVGVISAFLLIQVLVAEGGLSFFYKTMMSNWYQVMEMENVEFLIAAAFNTFYFVAVCIFAKRAEKTIGMAMCAMLVRRHVNIDYTRYSIGDNDKYLSMVPVIVLSAIAMGIGLTIYPVFAELLISTEVLVENMVGTFFFTLILAIGTQIVRSVGKRR